MKVLLVLLAVVSAALCARVPYIVGGNRVSYPGKYPWQATFRKDGSHMCGASLIGSRWLVTAAHCCYSQYRKYSVILGVHDMWYGTEGKQEVYNVTRVIIHPGYRHSMVDLFPNDMALLYVDRDVNMNEFVSPIALADKDEDFQQAECVITGWGFLFKGGFVVNVLMEVETDVMSASYCQNKMGYNYHASHLCAYRPGKAGCWGDDGGPLACRVGETWKLAGAGSYVFGKCSTSQPTVFTSVATLRDWIAETTGI